MTTGIFPCSESLGSNICLFEMNTAQNGKIPFDKRCFEAVFLSRYAQFSCHQLPVPCTAPLQNAHPVAEWSWPHRRVRSGRLRVTLNNPPSLEPTSWRPDARTPTAAGQTRSKWYIFIQITQLLLQYLWLCTCTVMFRTFPRCVFYFKHQYLSGNRALKTGTTGLIRNYMFAFKLYLTMERSPDLAAVNTAVETQTHAGYHKAELVCKHIFCCNKWESMCLLSCVCWWQIMYDVKQQHCFQPWSRKELISRFPRDAMSAFCFTLLKIIKGVFLLCPDRWR